ncbi:peptidase inhibitor family I36 protein [Streptomyces althioticus]|uniref:peptidase inhibitor family I36 protein n=1 Tax=Streptomyces althioticus TaxID=83380 RepID=UPI0033241307
MQVLTTHLRAVVAVTAVALFGPLATPATAAAPQSAAAAWTCERGAVCAYPNRNGTGKPCVWARDDKDWLSGNVVCSWSKKTKVKSVYNNGTTGANVGLYTATEYEGREVACLRMGQQINLSGSGAFIRSHTWEC